MGFKNRSSVSSTIYHDGALPAERLVNYAAGGPGSAKARRIVETHWPLREDGGTLSVFQYLEMPPPPTIRTKAS